MAEDIARTQLEAQIAQEAKELKEAPVIQPIVGQVKRCHLCGQVFSSEQVKPFREGFHEVHTGHIAREACPNCHPDRDIT